MPDGASEARIHANAVILREAGVLIRGASGAGKTALALAIVAEGRRAGWFGRMVADDTVVLRAVGGRLLAHPHERTAGLVERRGIGIVPIEHEPACVLRLVLDLGASPARMPRPADQIVNLYGIRLPRLMLPADAPTGDNVYRALDFFDAFKTGS